MKRDQGTVAYFRMLTRMVRAGVKRFEGSDAQDLYLLRELRTQVDEAMADAVTVLRREGWTWRTIGDATGTTPQAAIMKWAKR